jgi:Uma2 family endonuclease
MSEAQQSEQPRRKFTVDEVMRMVSAGILDEDDHVELIEGELFVMSPQDPPHSSAVERATSRLRKAYGPGFRVRVQLPLKASVRSLPEPDLAVVRGAEEDFDHRHPEGHEAVLVLEITSSSRRADKRKVRIYAAARVSNYWRLDVVGRRLEAYSEPDARGSFASTQLLDEHAVIALPGIDGQSVRVTDLLPGRER